MFFFTIFAIILFIVNWTKQKLGHDTKGQALSRTYKIYEHVSEKGIRTEADASTEKQNCIIVF